MEYSKQSIQSLKAAIKVLVAEQKSLKPQRKTVHFSGERSHTPYQATSKHQANRYDLRHMYIAYGIMRGKGIEVIEPKAKTPHNEYWVEKIIEKYEQAVRSDS
jgi:hypothetical protein